jgi:hypothetical protein
MRGKSTYPMRATKLRSSSVDRIRSRGRERRLVEDRIGCRRLIRRGISRGDSSEMGLTDSAEGEGISGKRFGRGSA